MTARTAFRPAPGRQRGFSMIEALIAAALIGVIAVGVIPMFTRSMTDNMAGSDYTRVSNWARSEAEDFSRQPFANFSTQVATGKTSGQTQEYYDPTLQSWQPGTPPANNPLIVWTRTTTYQQYGIDDINDNQLFDYPLPGGTTPGGVHIMEAKVQVQGISSIGLEGTRRSTTIRYLKAF